MAFPSVLAYLNGTIENGDAPSTIYVASIKGHPEFLKLGFCQLSSRSLRRSDPYISGFLYDACKDDDLIACHGDIARRDAYLVEQYLLELTTSYRETIPALAKARWSGYTETVRINPEAHQRFVEWVSFTVGNVLMRGDDGLTEMLDQLVVSAEEREVYGVLREELAQQQAQRMKRLRELGAINAKSL